MKPTRLAVSIAPVVWSLLLLPATPAPQTDEPRTGEQATMRWLFQELSFVFRIALNEDEFEARIYRDQILSALYSLAGNADQMATHGGSVDPSADYFARSLARDANEAVMRFRQGQYEGTRFLIDQLMNNCFACHSRLPADGAFQLGDRFLEETPVETLTAEDRARLQVTMRQFDLALDTYEQYFSSRTVSAGEIATSAALENYLRICLRVEEDCKRAIRAFDQFRQRPDIPPYIDKRLHQWTKDLEQIGKMHEEAERDPLASGRGLIRDAQYHNAYPNDPRGTVRFIVATGYLHRYLQSSPTDTNRLAEAYYLLGVAESYISPSYWRSQTDVLLERSIRTSPQSVYGRMAFSFLEEYTISGYTGSSGVNIPPEVQQRLDELRSLVESGEPR